MEAILWRGRWVNSLWPSDTIWRHKSGSTLAQVMASFLTAPSHYLNQCGLVISKVQWHSSECNFTRDTSAISQWNKLENYLSKILFQSPWGQWVNSQGMYLFSQNISAATSDGLRLTPYRHWRYLRLAPWQPSTPQYMIQLSNWWPLDMCVFTSTEGCWYHISAIFRKPSNFVLILYTNCTIEGLNCHMASEFLVSICAGNGLVPSLETIFSKIVIKIQSFSFNEIHVKMLLTKCWPFCSILSVRKHGLFGTSWAIKSKPGMYDKCVLKEWIRILKFNNDHGWKMKTWIWVLSLYEKRALWYGNYCFSNESIDLVCPVYFYAWHLYNKFH